MRQTVVEKAKQVKTALRASGFLVALLVAVLSVQTAKAGTTGVGVFGGFKYEGDAFHFAIGGEGEVSLIPLLSIHAFAEQTLGDHPVTDIGLGVALRPVPLLGLKFVAAPAVSLVAGETIFFGRLGAGYEFGLGPVHIGPVFNVDIASGGMAYVGGLVAGIGF